MKCPYRDFQDCIVEQCPSCNYKEVRISTIEGRHPPSFSVECALEKGWIWESTKTAYEFVSCKLIDNNIQPVPSNKEVINNNITNRTNVSIRKSIF